MRLSTTLVTTAGLLAVLPACTRLPAGTGELAPAVSSNSILRADRLQKMPGASALDALQTLPIYMGRTMRRPEPRFVLFLDGTRTSSLEMLRGIQASEVFEIRVIGESQSIDRQGEVDVIVTTFASRARIGHGAGVTAPT
jgi:hypothetical protein